MAEMNTLSGCCGVNELDGVGWDTPADALFGLLKCGEISSRNVVFTDITRNRKRAFTGGWAFAAFLRKNHLGTVLGPSDSGRNPNTGNSVCVWVWTPNRRALDRWESAEGVRRDKEEEDD